MYSQMIDNKYIIWKEKSSYKSSVTLDPCMNWDACAIDVLKDKMWCLYYKFSSIRNDIYNVNLVKNSYILSVILSFLIFDGLLSCSLGCIHFLLTRYKNTQFSGQWNLEGYRGRNQSTIMVFSFDFFPNHTPPQQHERQDRPLKWLGIFSFQSRGRNFL